jgi:mannose-6-phosphate isomerase-like protein (cupin superfamily)
MLSFLATQAPRTKVAHLNTISFDDGRSSIEFKPPSDKYLVINRWPPAATDEQTIPGKAKCALSPPPHWHRYQKETFHVLSGTGKFWLEGRYILAEEGEVVEIPAGAFHTFCNASKTDEFVVEFTLEPSTRKRDEEFFSKFGMTRYIQPC